MSEKVYTKKTPYGAFYSDREPGLKAVYKVIIGFFLILAILSLFMTFTQMGLYMLLCAALFGAFAYWSYCNLKKLDEAYDAFMWEVRKLKEEERKKHPHPDAEAFYLKAKAAGISDVDTDVNIARLAQFAKNNGIHKGTDVLVRDFSIGKEDVERLNATNRQKQQDAQNEKKRKEEAQLEAQYTRYAALIGSEKTIRMCRDQAEYYRQLRDQANEQLDSLRRNAGLLYRSTQEQEHNWAAAGGMASAIGGAGAGISVATDLQRKNAEILERNAQAASNWAQLHLMAEDNLKKEILNANSEVYRWAQRERMAQTLLTELPDEDQLLSRIVPRVTKMDFSTTGAAMMEVQVQPAPGLVIFDHVEAVVDGSFTVLLKIDSETVGTARCVIGLGGVSEKTTIPCISTDLTKKADSYDITFVPYHLWAVEKKDFS